MASAENPEKLVTFAIEVAREAGALAVRMRSQALRRIDTKSSPTDVVTAADHAVQALILERIDEFRPGDSFVGEESAIHGDSYQHVANTTGMSWIVDPIDGTVNYIYGAGSYAVSIAGYCDGSPVFGVVHDPVTGELWSALAGVGSWAGAPGQGVRLAASECDSLDQALVATGFSYRAKQRARQGAIVSELLPRIRDIRRHGAAALDLCYVAQGRVDAYFESGINIWDGAAAALIAAEAGVAVTDVNGGPWGFEMTIAAPPSLHSTLCAALKAAGAE